jgi:hypothetical protein
VASFSSTIVRVGPAKHAAPWPLVGAPRRDPADGGFVLVDATVALLIVSAVLVLSFMGVRTANAAALRAEEVRQAEILLRDLMLNGAHSLAPSHGETGSFAWTLEETQTSTLHPVALCDRRVTLRNLRSSRAYDVATVDTCPAPDL